MCENDRMTWSAREYVTFEEERTRPVRADGNVLVPFPRFFFVAILQ